MLAVSPSSVLIIQVQVNVGQSNEGSVGDELLSAIALFSVGWDALFAGILPDLGSDVNTR